MNLTSYVQERLVALYLWGDGPKGIRLVKALVPPALFDPGWKELAEAAAAYFERHQRAPGEDAASLVESLAARTPKKAETYKRLWESLNEKRADFDPEYVLEQARSFARYQKILAGTTAALEALEKNSEDGLLLAEKALTDSLRGDVNLTSLGTQITSPEALRFLDREDEVCEFPTGVVAFDSRNLTPARKQFWLFAGPFKFGKTQFLKQIAKRTVLRGRDVAYVTLEMSEEKISAGLLSTFFAISNRKAEKLTRVKLKSDKAGLFLDYENVEAKATLSLDEENARGKLAKLQRRLDRKGRLFVKEFPTGELTVPQLDGYLDSLEGAGYLPDLLIVDYADLMKLDADNLRGSTQSVYRGLRGIAVRKNIALASASQINRPGLTAATPDVKHLAEDIGKAGIVDTLIMGARTEAEKKKGLARLLVAAARGDEDRLRVVISQNYAIGQFSMSEALMSSSYISSVLEAKETDE